MVRVQEMADEYSSQEESEGSYHGSAKGGLRSRVAAAIVGVIGLVAVVAVLASQSSMHQASSSLSAATPLTVRALLESDEFADLATENLIAMDGNAPTSVAHSRVRDRVLRALQNVSHAIKAQHPEVHRRLGELQLTSAQKEASLRVVRKFGDPRMVGLARDIAEATRQAEQESSDQDTIKRRLSEALAPKVREVQQLSEEMFPGQAVSLDAAAALPQLRKWHPSMQVDLSGRRRLSEGGDGIEQGVHAHAHTLFKSLEGELGEKMPEAPARMLSDSSGGDVSFIGCVTKAIPDVSKVCKCMADNMSEVVSMMKDFMKGKMR